MKMNGWLVGEKVVINWIVYEEGVKERINNKCIFENILMNYMW